MKTEEEIKKEIEDFKDNKVWITKKSRMNAEQRMKRNDLTTQILINYYTFCVLGTSIWSFSEKNDHLNILTVIMSVGLFGVSIFMSSMNYKEQAIRYKDSYHRLNDLEFKLQELLESDRSIGGLKNKLQQYRTRYNNILELTENHAAIDYAIVAKTINTNDNRSTRCIYFYWFIIIIFNAVLFLSPLYLFYFFGGNSS